MPAYASPEDPERKPRHPGHGLLVAGVAAAAVMGVGLGLWARPEMSERRMALAVMNPVKPAVTRTLQIVLDDGPAPLGAPIELLPAMGKPPRVAPPERPAPDLLAPVRPATGLVRVQAVKHEPVDPPPRTIPKREPKPAPRKLAAPKVEKVAASKASNAKPAKLVKVKAVEKPKAAPIKVAKVQRKPAKANVRLASADRPHSKARIEKAVIAPHKVKVAPPKVQKVRLETKKPKVIPRAEKVARAVKPAAPKAATPPKSIKGAGPLRMAKAQRPPGETAVRDADRQMNRAYSSARAAGVPDWQLRKQQARWEAARASAAREAPWAVRDVYLARIAELHDLTKDAQASGY